MKMQKPRKTKLSVAIAAAMAGGMAVSNGANASDYEGPKLANIDRLGDAAIFQYYTAKGNWQTFFRLINTSSDHAIVVKLRYREAANSREVLDFMVALSPLDMWASWTDKDVFGTGAGPGVRTADTSCLFPNVNQGGDQAFKSLPQFGTNVAGALFKDDGFTDNVKTNQLYDDNGNQNPPSVLDRLSEGYVEVVGVSSYDCYGDDLGQSQFCQEVAHPTSPNGCTAAYNRFLNGGAHGYDMYNVLAANAYLINVPTGQGAGYDPDMIADCSNESLEWEATQTRTDPDLDSCNNSGFSQEYYGDWVALNQRLWDGSEPPFETYQHYAVDINHDGMIQHQARKVELNGVDGCNGIYVDPKGKAWRENDIYETNVPKKLFDAAQDTSGPSGGSALLFANAPQGCDAAVVTSGGDDLVWLSNVIQKSERKPWRIKQKGVAGEWPVTGGVDAVSALFMRDSVINEWAASPNPAAIVTDYFTQWVLTFPTKHYYVDLQTDPQPKDDISPTLVDISAGNDAFAPFSQEFDDGDVPGTSCEPFGIGLGNREESWVDYTSPAPFAEPGLCWETNVINFREAYATKGLNSSFSVTVPEDYLPPENTIPNSSAKATRGWAQLWFDGPGTWVGLSSEWKNYYGLPVTGFLFSVYNTVSPLQNHTTINEHKYTRYVHYCDGEYDSECAQPLNGGAEPK
jgi:hypothetical protein